MTQTAENFGQAGAERGRAAAAAAAIRAGSPAAGDAGSTRPPITFVFFSFRPSPRLCRHKPAASAPPQAGQWKRRPAGVQGEEGGAGGRGRDPGLTLPPGRAGGGGGSPAALGAGAAVALRRSRLGCAFSAQPFPSVPRLLSSLPEEPPPEGRPPAVPAPPPPPGPPALPLPSPAPAALGKTGPGEPPAPPAALARRGPHPRPAAVRRAPSLRLPGDKGSRRSAGAAGTAG